MARPLRVVYPGAVYHLIARGNNRRRVFLGVEDYTEFFSVLRRTVDRYGWLCHAYCLMGNHYHLLVETPLPNLPLGMRQLNGVFAQRHNKRHRRVGHVFQARYTSILVERDSHLLSVLRYLAWNPVRARLCTRPDAWAWSSYPAFLGLRPRPGFLSCDWVLGQFADDRRVARNRLRLFVEGEPTARVELRAGVYAAGEEFLREHVGDREPVEEIPRRQWQPVPPTVAEIFDSDERPVATAYRRYGYSLREIAEYLECHYSTVSRRLRREEDA